jgi:hypothetical protein
MRLGPVYISDAMIMANYSTEEVSNLSFRRFLQHALPGYSLKPFRALVANGNDETTTDDPVKLTKLITILKNAPWSNVPDAMIMANYSTEEVFDLSF